VKQSFIYITQTVKHAIDGGHVIDCIVAQIEFCTNPHQIVAYLYYENCLEFFKLYILSSHGKKPNLPSPAGIDLLNSDSKNKIEELIKKNLEKKVVTAEVGPSNVKLEKKKKKTYEKKSKQSTANQKKTKKRKYEEEEDEDDVPKTKKIHPSPPIQDKDNHISSLNPASHAVGALVEEWKSYEKELYTTIRSWALIDNEGVPSIQHQVNTTLKLIKKWRKEFGKQFESDSDS